MTIWSKYFDVSGMIKSQLVLHRTRRQLDFPVSTGEHAIVPGEAQLGALKTYFSKVDFLEQEVK